VALAEEGDLIAAQQQLLRLVRRFPASKPVLVELLDVCLSMKDWRTYAYYGEQLLPLERGDDRADTLNNLVYAHSELQHPALIWHYGQALLAKHPDYIHVQQVRSFVESMEQFLLEQAGDVLGTAELTDKEKLRLMVEHDRVRFYTEAGHSRDSIKAAERVLEKLPRAVPILNNLSLSQFIVGDVDQAIETAQKVLAQNPDNYHALSNLVRYTFLSGQFDQAQSYADRLELVTSDNPDLEVKQAETFAYLSDDKKVWAAYQQARSKHSKASPLMLHLAAAASYRLGEEETAWKLWREAVKAMPSLTMAKESLAEKGLPVGERHVPWYWPFPYWLSQDLISIFGLDSKKDIEEIDDNIVGQKMKSLLVERPYLGQLFSHMLERGDRIAREFVMNMTRLIRTPELLQILDDFSRSPFGPDQLRLEANQFISQNYPEMLPEDRKVPMWINGQQTEIFSMGFEITDEPAPVEGISEAVLDKHELAYDLLMNDEPEAAEPLLQEIIAEEPGFPSAYNQLAVAYQMQGQSEKARALIEETHARFPDYFFARVALARLLAQEKEIGAARQLLEPLTRLQKLHISEFRALAQAEMDIALADNRPEAARRWLEIWEQVDEGNPEIIQWRMRIDGPELLLKELKERFFARLPGKGSGRKKR
jgi:tetratricopeptide (TPR) repeat protein